jgi:hypothetical protein
MDTNTFIAALRGLRHVPADDRKVFEQIAADLPPEQREFIMTRLMTIEKDMAKNEQSYCSSLKRGISMTQQVKANDLPALSALTDA